MKQLQDFLPKHWLIIAAGGVGAYVAFLAGLKGALPDLLRNELLGLYSAITGLLIVICLIVIPGIRKAPIGPKAKGQFTRILITWIVSGLVGIILFLVLMSPSPLMYVWEHVRARLQPPSIAIQVHHENGRSQLVSREQPVVVRPGEKITLTVELPTFSENLRRDYTFLATFKFGDVGTLSSYEFEYTAPTHEPVDYIIICATNRRTGQRLKQPFNVVIQE